jgi:hypothetical protein
MTMRNPAEGAMPMLMKTKTRKASDVENTTSARREDATTEAIWSRQSLRADWPFCRRGPVEMESWLSAARGQLSTLLLNWSDDVHPVP